LQFPQHCGCGYCADMGTIETFLIYNQITNQAWREFDL
jgi:hypothetical protein